MYKRLQEAHLCRECYEIDRGFTLLTNDQKRCVECGGVVLTLQEAADYIAEQAEELRSMREIYE